MPFLRNIIRWICLLPSLASLCAQEAKTVPRVLIAGDGFYQQSYKSIATELATQAQVTHRHPGSTGAALAGMDEWLGPEKWDVIYFNFGHADLVYRDPQSKSVRVMSRHAGGVRTTSPETYEANLLEIIKRLKATGAKLVWASTPPLPNSDQLFQPQSEVEYNQIAARVMEREKVPQFDAYAIAKVELEGRQKRREPGYKDPMVPSIAAAIRQQLPPR